MMKENSLEFWLDYIQTLEPKEIELGLERIKPIYKKLIKSNGGLRRRIVYLASACKKL